MDKKYESPNIEIIKFSLSTRVLTASDTGEGDIEEFETFPTVPGDAFG